MSDPRFDLEISRFVAAPPHRVWQVWADPKLLAQWWCPRPWTTEVRAFDFRPGGAFHTFMRGPDGGESDNPGCFLDLVPEERIVFTSMLTGGWRPATPWMAFTAVFTLAGEKGGTRYTARVMHKDEAERRRHLDLGFHEGWGTCMAQLEEVAKSL
ncbi:MAG: SRPBCC family protein [Rhodospirillaceae bacterium]|nr:SRPBCC family protein [Rhodospirillaceae bacterium]